MQWSPGRDKHVLLGCQPTSALYLLSILCAWEEKRLRVTKVQREWHTKWQRLWDRWKDKQIHTCWVRDKDGERQAPSILCVWNKLQIHREGSINTPDKQMTLVWVTSPLFLQHWGSAGCFLCSQMVQSVLLLFRQAPDLCPSSYTTMSHSPNPCVFCI